MHHSTSRYFFDLCLRYKKAVLIVSKKMDPCLCEDGIEKMSLGITVCHQLTSLLMSNGGPGDGFVSHPHNYDIF